MQTSLKMKIKSYIEVFLDILFDTFIPYRVLSNTRLREWSVPANFIYSYVFNQKFQRLQLLHILRENGINDPHQIKAWWSRGLNNFGDELLAYLLARIAAVECIYDRNKSMLAIGSIIRFARDNSFVWGSGIIREDEIMEARPTCLAVRGPLTRKKMLEQDIPCPEVYGDPAMLFPLFFKPQTISGVLKIQGEPRKPLIIPHFKHDTIVPRFLEYDYQSLLVTSIGDIERVVSHISAAPSVVTSSLHGFIFCVAYGIPVSVFKLKKKGIGGDNIKFDDFCYGVGLDPIAIHEVDTIDKEQIEYLLNNARIYAPNWTPVPLLEGLNEICQTETLSAFIKNVKSGYSCHNAA